eukprot:341087-Pyramimonas_sp.AAC.1
MKRTPDDALEEEVTTTNGKNHPPRRQRTLVGCGFVVPPRPPPSQPTTDATSTVPVVEVTPPTTPCSCSGCVCVQYYIGVYVVVRPATTTKTKQASRPPAPATMKRRCVTTWLVASFVRLQFSVRCVRTTASLVVTRRGCSSLAG